MNNYIGALGIAAGAGLVAYCVYFDHRRRSAPDYKEKVKARRAAERERARLENEIQLPDPDDKTAIDQFFVRQIELGEELIQTDVDRAVKHLSYAVVYCPQPKNLIAYLRDVLPPTAFDKLAVALQEATSHVNSSKVSEVKEEDDVE